MTANFYDKVIVKINYKNSFGSGVLISDMKKNNSYLISAWHCFKREWDIDFRGIEIFRQEENNLKQISLNFKDKIIDQKNDIIIFEIEYIEDIPQYQIINAEIKDKVTVVGFPYGLSSDECMTHRYIIRGEINDIPKESIVQVNSNRSFETYLNDAKENMSGYSGCGIFVESEKTPYLCGIIIQLGSEEGIFAFVNGISIVAVDNILYEEKETHLPNAKME